MEATIQACYTAALEAQGRRTMHTLELAAHAGQTIYLYGSPARRQLHFEVLCGLRKPGLGSVFLNGQDLYAQGAAFRRDCIGAIPDGGGLIPELPMITQVILPMKLAGLGRDRILARLQELASDRMPLHSLYNLPGKGTPRKQACAALFRAVIQKPGLLVVNGFLDDFEEPDAGALWDTLLSLRPKDSVLIYLSGAPAPEQITWTQKWKL